MRFIQFAVLFAAILSVGFISPTLAQADLNLKLEIQLDDPDNTYLGYHPGARIVGSGNSIEICNRDVVLHKPFMIIHGQSGFKKLNVHIPKRSCETFVAPEVEERTQVTIACEIHADEKVHVTVLPRANGPTIAKTPFVKECMAGNLGGEPQSAIACGCFYDKLANDASEHAREAMFIGAKDG